MSLEGEMTVYTAGLQIVLVARRHAMATLADAPVAETRS